MIKGIKYSIPANFAGSILRMALVSVLMLLCGLFSLRAQDNVSRVKVLFPFDSDVVVENYQGNAGALSVLNETFAAQAAREGLTITSYSSPEGNLAYNRNLSLRRAKSMQAYLEGKYPQLQGKITLRPGEEAWEDLRIQVESDSRLSESTRSAVLSIIGKDIEADAKERELTALPEYKRLYANYFKSLRFAAIELRIENFADSEKDFANSEISDASLNGGKSATAEGRTTTVEKGLPVIYYTLNEDFIRPQYMGNDKSMKEIIALLKSGKVESMVIEGTASPEGPAKGNERLAKDRAENLKNYITGMFPELENKITVVSKGAIEGAEEEYPYLRYARIASIEVQDGAKAEEPVVTEEPVVREEPVVTEEPTKEEEVVEPVKEEEEVIESEVVTVVETAPDTVLVRKPVIAVSTNALYDLAITPNFAVEVPLGQKWSVFADYSFPWWVNRANDWAWQMLKLDIGGRFWLSRHDKEVPMDVLNGHFLGVFGMTGYYDIEPKHEGYQGEFLSFGLEYGYAWNLGKNKRWRLDASIGAGWLGTQYRYYIGSTDDQHLLYQNNGKLDWFGPLKANVSIKYIFSHTVRRVVK